MQLFISNQFQLQGKNITINDERIIYQCRKVLRYKPGDSFVLQSEDKRYTIEIGSRDKKPLQWTVISTQEYSPPKETGNRQFTGPEAEQITGNHLIVAMTNKRDKMELICQKATEIGIDTIGIRTSKRSVIQIIWDNKIDRLKTICLEAAEQSRNRHVPTITFTKSIKDLPPSFVAYQDGVPLQESLKLEAWNRNSLIVWPEWGFEPSELEYFEQHNFPFIKLGDSILRTETAAIIGAWQLKNYER